jgi:hypothetical protein
MSREDETMKHNKGMKAYEEHIRGMIAEYKDGMKGRLTAKEIDQLSERTRNRLLLIEGKIDEKQYEKLEMAIETRDNLKNIKFQELGKKERKLLLKALDIPLKGLKCRYCKEKVSYTNCSILPGKKIETIIACSSPLCMSQYLDDEVEG